MWQVRRNGIAAAALALTVLGASATGVRADGPAVTGARIGEQPGQTRFVLDLTGPTSFQAYLMADPYRAVVDLPELEWRLPLAAISGRGLITAMRYGLFKPGTTRLVLDLAGPAVIAKSFTLSPLGESGHRIVLDLKPASREELLAVARAAISPAAGPPQVAPASPRGPALSPLAAPRRNPTKRVVAIDPGHGGIDPGALGADGAFEKEITLAHAQALRRALIATGRYDVVMTREADMFLALRERIRVAQAGSAEMFISLHADTLTDRSIRGGTVYTLSEHASDAEAAALATRENRADTLAGVDLSDHSQQVAQILIELTQRVTMNASAVLARDLVEELSAVTTLMHNTHRFAGFAVLKSPEVPSVLVEMGYLSNRQDERQLKDTQFRARMAAAMVKAIDRYFASEQALKRP